MRPTKEQERKLRQCLHLTNRLYNEALQELIDHYKENGKFMRNYDQQRLHGKSRHPDLPAYVIDEVINRLHRAFAKFFNSRKGKSGKIFGYPRFKPVGRWRSFGAFILSTQGSFSLIGSKFHGGKKLGGNIRVSLPRPPLGRQKMSKVVLKPSGWYVLIITDHEGVKLEANDKAIGLDFGIKNLIADSDGGFVENPQLLKSALKKLRVANRRIGRREKGSKRRYKACRMMARISEKIGRQRRDYYRKVIAKYVNENGTIVIEDLSPSNMVKNRNFSRSIMDSSWGMLRGLLESKAESAGRQVIAVPPHYTSQKCSKCGEVVQKSLSVRTHICPWCGLIEDRDVNAAKNILRAGVRPSGVNVENIISSVA